MNHVQYNKRLFEIYQSFPDAQKEAFATRFSELANNPTTIFGFPVYLGMFGMDRFLLGNILLGLIKLLTAGGLGIWYLVDLFLVTGLARKKNIVLAKKVVDWL
jgi:TM2 domain-containing membrane protein YozV